MKTEDMPVGVVDCLRLHIFAEPDLKSEIDCKVRFATQVVIDMDNSTEDFYKFYTAIGAEGFCEKDHIFIKP